MNAEEIASKFPRLFHVTSPSVVPLIRQHGLLSTHALLDLFGTKQEERIELTRKRRPETVAIHNEVHGTAYLTDNKPLSEKALGNCLDDELTPAEWLDLLNSKVFFWPDEKKADTLLKAAANLGRERVVLVLDTKKIVEHHMDTVAFSPINSGSTIHKPARRGLMTFARAEERSYREWRTLRRSDRLDRVKEIVVDHAVPRAAEALVDVRFSRADQKTIPHPR